MGPEFLTKSAQILGNKAASEWFWSRMRYWWGVVLLTLVSAHAETTLRSGPERVSLLELYTSEGCSSCPPAESWLTGLQKDGRLWKEIVPVAFHVNYWDDLGWKDRFAKQEYTSRQREYSMAWGTSSVYTPGFALDGQEWKGWFNGSPLPEPGDRSAGKLEVKIEGQTATISFSEISGMKEMEAHLGAAGDGCQFGCVSRRESRPEVSAQFCRPGSYFAKIERQKRRVHGCTSL